MHSRMPHGGRMTSRWTPASVRALRHYSWPAFGHDLLAGVTVGLVALPLAMAFAIASGLRPEQGIYCAIVSGFLISALGASRYQIAGPPPPPLPLPPPPLPPYSLR